MKSKLDVSALFHCAMKNSKYINTFRITITLKEKIDKVILQQVVDQLLHQYPTICSYIFSQRLMNNQFMKMQLLFSIRIIQSVLKYSMV